MANALSLDELLQRLRNPDDAVRGPAWQAAAPLGGPAVKPLAALMADADFETARAARRALWLVVRHTARPGATRELAAVRKELLPLLQGPPAAVRRELVWMASEICGDDAVAPLAALLNDAELREDARAALTRIPGRKATAALRSALDRAPADFQIALADSLRRRGETVRGFPSSKLVPVRATSVTAPSPT